MTPNVTSFKDRTPPEFTHVPFRVARAAETAVQMGLVTLETDLTIETELRHFIGDAVGADIGHDSHQPFFIAALPAMTR